MPIPTHFKLIFSKGSPWISSYLLNYSSQLPFSEALQVSSKLHKNILRVNKEIEKHGLPKNLHLGYVHPKVKSGVFLKPNAQPIKAGAFIGIYTGLYELVESDITTGTSYAYDVAQNLTIHKKNLHHVVRPQEDKKEKKEYSIQTNALEMGNFTRYINHSSLAPNIEAIVSKLPDGRMEILLFALHDIHPGEQLLSNYGGQYWKALKVIPNDMKADTYLLTPGFKIKLSNPIAPIPAKHKSILMSLRNVLVHEPSPTSSFTKSLKAQIPSVSKKQKKEIDAFEEIVLEQGIPRKWKFSIQKDLIKVSLKTGEKIIRKNDCIGLIAGTFSFLPSKHSFLVAKKKKTQLFLDFSKESNFLSHIPRDSKKGNVTLRLRFDKEENTPILLAFASQTIRPKEELILNDIIPILLT